MIKDNIFDVVKTALRGKYGENIYISDTPLSNTVPSFPAVSIVCVNNTINQAHSTFGKAENVAIADYSVDVYSNDINTKDEEAREIAELISDTFTQHRYYRTAFNPVDNLLDSSIARYNAKFRKTDIVG